MRKLLLLAGLLLAACGTAACNGDDNKNDGGDARVDASSDGSPDGSADGSVDAGRTATGRACTQDNDCGGSPYACNRAYPGGFCTRQCTRDRDCGTGYVCDANYGLCFKGCEQDKSPPDCADGTACFQSDPDVSGICLPSCYTTPPSGVAACVGGTVCDPYALITPSCSLPEADGGTPTGADNGAPCTEDSDCKSQLCYGELGSSNDPMQATGFVGGICYSNARVPTSGFAVGQPLPVGSCPPNNYAFPYSGGGGGDVGLCTKKCRQPSDCRAGYQCNIAQLTRNGQVVGMALDGTCDPINCLSTTYATAPNHGCPETADCIMQTPRTGQTGTLGRCVTRSLLGTDGGTGDASVTDAANDGG